MDMGTGTGKSLHVLNLDGPPNVHVRRLSSGSRSASDLAVELQKTMLSLKGQHMSADGREVHYHQIKDSPLFSEYEKVARKLASCELKDLQGENERKSFFISILAH